MYIIHVLYMQYTCICVYGITMLCDVVQISKRILTIAFGSIALVLLKIDLCFMF